MKKSELVAPVFRNRLKFLMKLCTLMLIISFGSGFPDSLRAQQPQTREISGTVTDSKGQPVVGASVIVKGTTIGKNTDIDGKFRIMVPVDARTLTISFIGMKPQEVDITGKASVTAQLADETVGLEEVVVVGYGTQKKVTVTGAVTTVGNAQLIQAPVANISNALAGRTPGLITQQRSGEPGSDQTTLRIRGVSTFSGSQDPLIMIDGIEAQTYNNLDPNEIENITVLKDASATAVYGVRGANGVLIITTKRGKLGKPQLSYSSNFAMNQYVNLRTRSDAYRFSWGWDEVNRYDSYITGNFTPLFTDSDLQKYKDHSDPIFHPDQDLESLMIKDRSYQQQHNLNIRGGTDKVKYFISAGLFKQGGLWNNTDLQPDFIDIQTYFTRYNFRSNFDFIITKRLSATLDLSDQIQEKRGSGMDPEMAFRMISCANPSNNPYLTDGKLVYITTAPLVGGYAHPLQYWYSQGVVKRYSNYLNGSVRLNYDLGFLARGLSAHGTMSYQNNNNHNVTFTKTILTYKAFLQADGSTAIVPQNDQGPFGSSESTPNKNRRTYAEVGLDYSRSFGNHNFTGLLLYNQAKRFDPNLQFVIPSGYQGLVGRVAYNYDGRYLAEFNMGYNGTENFAPGKRFGFFPAFSGGWVLSDESFFPKNNIVTFLKLRGSYGEVGNDQIGGNRFLFNPTAYTYQNNTYYFGLVGVSSSAYKGSYGGKIGNPDITWERAKKTDFGFELNLFREKLRISFDYFSEKRDNILASVNTVPAVFGSLSNLPTMNIGKMKNSGYDGEATLTMRSGKFNWWIKGNYTYAHNVVVYRNEIFNPYPYLYTTGLRYGQYFTQMSDGFYNTWLDVSDAYRPRDTFQSNRLQPGDPHQKDVNGDGVYDSYDSGPQGYSNFPEITYGFSFGGDFKGFDFSVMFQGAAHVTFPTLNATHYQWRWQNNASPMDYVFDYAWTQERYENGELITWPRLARGGGAAAFTYNQSSVYIVNAAYLRFKNAELGYTIPENSIFKRFGIGSARFYLNGSNLYTFITKEMRQKYPGVDPESPGGSGNYEPIPLVKTINLGVNINF